MARLVLIKDLSKINPSTIDVILSTLVGPNGLKRHDETTIYNAGDKAFQIINGEVVIKECILDGTKGSDFDSNWTVIESILGGDDSNNKNPETFQTVSYFEKKLMDDIVALTDKVSNLVDLSSSDLRNTFIFPLFTEEEVAVENVTYDFGRLII